MFKGNMVTEAIPARVFSLYKIVTSKKEITRIEAQLMMEPKDIHDGQAYSPSVFNAAKELKLIDVQDDLVIPLVEKEKVKTIEDFRNYVVSKIKIFEDESFYKVTNTIVNMNEEIYKYKLTSNELLKLVSHDSEKQITDVMMRGWRFWAQFLGFGYINDMYFLPNGYVFLKEVLKLSNLEKNKEYDIDEFMSMIDLYGKILIDNLQPERNMNVALSSAFRQLHDNNEIELKYNSDAERRWNLYPSMDHFNAQISSIVYKGVRS